MLIIGLFYMGDMFALPENRIVINVELHQFVSFLLKKDDNLLKFVVKVTNFLESFNPFFVTFHQIKINFILFES